MLSQTLLSVKRHQCAEDVGFIKVLLSVPLPHCPPPSPPPNSPTLLKFADMREKIVFSHFLVPIKLLFLGFCEMYDTSDRVIRSQGLCQERGRVVNLAHFCYINQINCFGAALLQSCQKK